MLHLRAGLLPCAVRVVQKCRAALVTHHGSLPGRHFAFALRALEAFCRFATDHGLGSVWLRTVFKRRLLILAFAGRGGFGGKKPDFGIKKPVAVVIPKPIILPSRRKCICACHLSYASPVLVTAPDESDIPLRAIA